MDILQKLQFFNDAYLSNFTRIDIVSHIDKQQIVANIVKYAHQRGMYIVAEGVETAEELKKVLELEVDLLQGYYLSRPAATPGAINPDALKIIEENRKR